MNIIGLDSLHPHQSMVKENIKDGGNANVDADHFVCQRDGFFRHEFRCDVYYLCAGGESLRLICEPGTSFDPALNMCVWNQMVPGCDMVQDIVHSTAGTDQGDSDKSRRTIQAGKSEAVPLSRSSINAGFSCPESTGLFALSSSCEVYISCVEGYSTIMRCLPGMAFDQQTERCVARSLVPGCSESKHSFSDNPTAPTNTHTRPFSCFNYSHRSVFRHQCQPGTAYSPEVRSCTWKYLVPQCWRQATLADNTKDVLHLPKEIKSPHFAIDVKEKSRPMQSKYGDDNISAPESSIDDKRWAQNLKNNQQTLSQKSKLVAALAKFFKDHYLESADEKKYHDFSYEGQRGNPNPSAWKESSSMTAHADSEQVRHTSGSGYGRFGDVIPQEFSSRNTDRWRWSQPLSDTEKSHNEVPVSPHISASHQYLLQSKSERRGLPEFQCPPVKDGFYRDDVLCDVFHRCVMGERFTFVCPPGTFFRIEGNFCDHSAIMPDCNQDGVRISALSRFPELRTFSSQPEAAHFPAPESWTYPSDSRSDYRVTPLDRPNSQQKLYDFQSRVETNMQQNNCRQFLFCAHSVPLVLTCPTTLLYNMRTLTCDFPAKVVCPSQIASLY
ncbi:neurotrypsin [Elysia marginata]|uniref:Neurotrypsin n=1 Tax=Elysia marginata TaxID=1093978 RepID=A0AAV4GZF5_9GAST|nr:neurotrypsin [Elysia marginata]